MRRRVHGNYLIFREEGAHGQAGSGFGRKSLEADLIAFGEGETMEQREFANVWEALSDSPDEAANRTMRSNPMIAIQRKVAPLEAHAGRGRA